MSLRAAGPEPALRNGALLRRQHGGDFLAMDLELTDELSREVVLAPQDDAIVLELELGSQRAGALDCLRSRHSSHFISLDPSARRDFPAWPASRVPVAAVGAGRLDPLLGGCEALPEEVGDSLPDALASGPAFGLPETLAS